MACSRPSVMWAKRIREGVVALMLAMSGLQLALAQCLPAGAVPNAVMSAKVLVLGELHGTEQAPAFAAALLCTLVAEFNPWILAIELQADEQAPLEAYLRTGDELALAEHLRSSFVWSTDVHDGKRSAAMLGLIKQARALVAQGKPVRILAFDVPSQSGGPAMDRHEAMANALQRALQAHPDHQLLVLTGTSHAAKTAAASFNPSSPSAIARLAHPQTVSLRMASEGGTAWVCMGVMHGRPDCSAKPFAASGRRANKQPFDLIEPTPRGFDGYFYVGKISASPPAVVAP